MQNDNQAAIKEMLKSFAYLLDEALKKTTKTYDGIVLSSTSDSRKWNVKYNNEVHTIKIYGVGTPTANMMVKVIVPQGNQALAWFFVPTGSGGGSGDGATFIPNVSESGIISWTNDKNLPNPEPVNIKGPPGDTGDIGPQGPKGDVGETGPYFTPSVSQEGVISWTNNGELENPNEVNIKGPQGEVGPQGPIGPEGLQGPQGVQGPIGETGPYFTPSVNINGDLSWENNGGLPNPQTINIRGPQGIQGPTGEKGEQGEVGPTGPAGPQGPQGEQGATGPYFTPSVDSSGNLSWINNGGLVNPSPVNIRGPQGIQGETGATGPQGSPGPSGANATINGVNALTINVVGGLTSSQSGSIFTIDGSSLQSNSLFNKIFNGVLPTTGWTLNNNIYYNQITVPNMTADQIPLIFPQWTANQVNEEIAWNSIKPTVQTFNGYIRFYSNAPITTSVSFALCYKV